MNRQYPLRLIVALLVMLALASCNLATDEQDETAPPSQNNAGDVVSTPTPLPPDTGIRETGSDCLIQVPNEAFVFDAPSFNANRQTILQSPVQVAGLARTEDNWFEVELPEGQRGMWVHGSQINFGNDMANDQRCQSLPVVDVDAPQCIATNITSDVQTIYATSSLVDYIGRFHPATTLPVLSRSEAALEVWVGAFAVPGWIEVDIASLSGECDGL